MTPVSPEAFETLKNKSIEIAAERDKWKDIADRRLKILRHAQQQLDDAQEQIGNLLLEAEK